MHRYTGARHRAAPLLTNQIKLLIVVGLVTLAALLGLQLQADGRAEVYDYDRQPAPVPVAQQVTQPVATGCVIRLDPQDGAYIHDNGAHRCTGLDPVDPNAITVQADGDLYVQHSAWRGAIITMSVEEDESLSQRVNCGPSGGTTSTTIRCWDAHTNERISVLHPSVTCDLCNFWLSWLHTGPEVTQ